MVYWCLKPLAVKTSGVYTRPLGHSSTSRYACCHSSAESLLVSKAAAVEQWHILFWSVYLSQWRFGQRWLADFPILGLHRLTCSGTSLTPTPAPTPTQTTSSPSQSTTTTTTSSSPTAKHIHSHPLQRHNHYHYTGSPDHEHGCSNNAHL